MNQNAHSLEYIREKLTYSVLLAAATFSGIALCGSLLRIPSIGFIPLMWIHIGVTLVLISIFIFRSYISQSVKAYAISILFFLAGVSGIHSLGIAGNGLILIVGACVYVSFMISMRVAIIMAISGGLILLTYMGLVQLNAIEFEIEQSTYNLSMVAWLTSFFTYALVVGIALFLIKHFLSYLQSLLHQQQNTIADQYSEIERSETILQSVVNNLPYGILWKDKDLKYLGANQIFVNDLGLNSFSELKGKTDAQIQIVPSTIDFESLDKRILSGEKSLIQYEEQTSCENGDTRYTETTRAPLYSKQGDLIGIIVSYYDVSAHKKLELKATTALAEAEKASLAKSQFLANMSHEIRTPINGILGLLDLCLHTELSDIQTGYLNRADFSAKLLLQIINDVLDLSKIESGHFLLEKHSFSFDAILAQLNNLFLYQANSKSIKFETKLIGKQQLNLEGDPTRVMQILMNLCSNAIKFTSEGRVSVTVTLVADEQQAKVNLNVSDTGLGIAEKSIPNLFEKFTQADGTITRKYGGTGLGLSIVKQLVEAMDGTIKVNSEHGKGTEFVCTLQFPVCQRVTVKKEATSEKVDLTGCRILLVEDNPINQEIAQSMLEQSGAIVALASDGQQALDQLQAANFDAVLLDVQMPVMDGCTAVKLIRQQKEWEKLPVIALTANVLADEVSHYKDIGFTEHLGKPFERKSLIEIVKRCLLSN